MSNQKFKLPDTGQVKVYDKDGRELNNLKPGEELYGQDGCFTVNPISFTKMDAKENELSPVSGWEDGYRLLQDNNTGLMWEIKSPVEGDLNFAEDRYNWEDAQKAYIEKLNSKKYCGFNDWRLPNKDELRSFIDYSRTNPAVDTLYFPFSQNDLYWCKNTYEMQPYFGWVIFFGLGSATAAGKTSLQYVRAVRGGYNRQFGEPDLSRFTDNGDGTVTDSVTQLMWQQAENPRATWFEAIKSCNNLGLAGHNDWRLPNIKELNTILDLTREDGWWYYKKFFPAEGLQPPLLHYNSSTSYEQIYCWVKNFNFGYDGYYANKMAPLLYRAVRHVDPIEIKAPVFKLPSTNQLLCYDDEGNEIATPQSGQDFYGQAGNYNANPLSFTKMDDVGKESDDSLDWEYGWASVKDNNTGLIWEVKSPDPASINYFDNIYTYDEAYKYVEELNKINHGGFSDWRLPSKEELRGIVDYSGITPAVNSEFFPDMLPEFYWSKDVYGSDKRLGWGIYFGYGCAICYLKTAPYHVRAVRGGHNPAFGDTSKYSFKDNGDGTVTDLNTRLMWMKDETEDMTLIEALKFCENLKLGGYNDWRMPDMKELPTLFDLNFSNGKWFFEEYFPNVKTKPLGFYWASNTFCSTFGWGVNFQFGYDGYYAGKKEGKYPFKPVRNAD